MAIATLESACSSGAVMLASWHCQVCGGWLSSCAGARSCAGLQDSCNGLDVRRNRHLDVGALARHGRDCRAGHLYEKRFVDDSLAAPRIVRCVSVEQELPTYGLRRLGKI